jgi:mannose-6-phosphate isomerase-like protein (cupin superfamily)
MVIGTLSVDGGLAMLVAQHARASGNGTIGTCVERRPARSWTAPQNKYREDFMRAQFAAITVIATTVASGAFAQQATPPLNTFMSNKDIMALVDKAKADRKGDAPLVAEPILQLAPYKAQLEYRPGTSPAAFHEKDAELMVVLDGTGNIVTDGKLVDEKRINANNLSGSSIADGVTHAVVKGDMIIIPANTPHQVIPTGGAPIVIMTMHVPYPAAGWPPAN